MTKTFSMAAGRLLVLAAASIASLPGVAQDQVNSKYIPGNEDLHCGKTIERCLVPVYVGMVRDQSGKVLGCSGQLSFNRIHVPPSDQVPSGKKIRVVWLLVRSSSSDAGYKFRFIKPDQPTPGIYLKSNDPSLDFADPKDEDDVDPSARFHWTSVHKNASPHEQRYDANVVARDASGVEYVCNIQDPVIVNDGG